MVLRQTRRDERVRKGVRVKKTSADWVRKAARLRGCGERGQKRGRTRGGERERERTSRWKVREKLALSSLMISVWSFFAAIDSAVFLYLSFDCGSAPPSSSIFTTAVWPRFVATSSAVRPALSFVSVLTPASSKMRVLSRSFL